MATIMQLGTSMIGWRDGWKKGGGRRGEERKETSNGTIS